MLTLGSPMGLMLAGQRWPALDVILSGSLDQRVTFARASTATLSAAILGTLA